MTTRPHVTSEHLAPLEALERYNQEVPHASRRIQLEEPTRNPGRSIDYWLARPGPTTRWAMSRVGATSASSRYFSGTRACLLGTGENGLSDGFWSHARGELPAVLNEISERSGKEFFEHSSPFLLRGRRGVAA